MARVFFISDLHLGHRNILKFVGPLRGGTNVDEHDEWLVEQWNRVVHKRDLVWVLGDVAFEITKMPMLDRMYGTKKLVLGNHDMFDLGVYRKHFSKIYGLVSHRKYWLSHAPMHPAELRGRKNIHGHMHKEKLDDDRYINVCVEQSYGIPRTLEQLEAGFLSS